MALRDPASVGIVTRVLSIPVKRTEKRLVGYLTRPEIDALLAAPDQTGWLGRRDHALLLTMYNSGARASEVTSLRRGQVRFDTTTYLQLHGKGRKERTVPLWPKTARVLQQWFREREIGPDGVVFPTVRGTPLSSDGLDHLFQQAVRRAGEACPSLVKKRITPHLVRHYAGFRTIPGGAKTDWRNTRQCWVPALSLLQPPGIVWSQVLEESEQLVARLVAAWLSAGRRGFGQNLFFHGEICLEIDLRSFHRLVAQPKSDDRSIDTRLQQPHCHRVPTNSPFPSVGPFWGFPLGPRPPLLDPRLGRLPGDPLAPLPQTPPQT